jgi:hypothetical protein
VTVQDSSRNDWSTFKTQSNAAPAVCPTISYMDVTALTSTVISALIPSHISVRKECKPAYHLQAAPAKDKCFSYVSNRLEGEHIVSLFF